LSGGNVNAFTRPARIREKPDASSIAIRRGAERNCQRFAESGGRGRANALETADQARTRRLGREREQNAAGETT
jgi:hypothetical protein